MIFHLLKRLCTEILVKPVLDGLKPSYAPGNENKNPIILALLIGQEAVFSL